MLNLDTCGIEVSAKTLLVQLRRNDKILPHRTFNNTLAGRRALAHYLSGKRGVRICMEATGTYGLDLALELSKIEAFQLMVANPKAMRNYAGALQKRGKTDLIDVAVIEDFALRMEFKPWQAPTPSMLDLRALARRIQELGAQKTAEKNRLHAAKATASSPKLLQQNIERSLYHLEKSRKSLQLAALDLIKKDPLLLRRYRLLLGVKGIASLSATLILAEVTPLPNDLTARQWVAFAGLDPKSHQSGSSIDKKARLSKAGNTYLRRALYMPALSAVFRDPAFQTFYLKLLARDKRPLQAICAAMRKLLHGIYGMFRNDQPFDAARLFASNPPPETLSDPRPLAQMTPSSDGAIYCQFPLA